jgi:hypothetical protein
MALDLCERRDLGSPKGFGSFATKLIKKGTVIWTEVGSLSLSPPPDSPTPHQPTPASHHTTHTHMLPLTDISVTTLPPLGMILLYARMQPGPEMCVFYDHKEALATWDAERLRRLHFFGVQDGYGRVGTVQMEAWLCPWVDMETDLAPGHLNAPHNAMFINHSCDPNTVWKDNVQCSFLRRCSFLWTGMCSSPCYWDA